MSELQVLRKQVKKFVDTASEKELEMVYLLFDASKRKDWWDEINGEQRKAIDKGLKQLDNGEGIPHEEVMKKYAKWLKK
jgi:predicted transcriptional regulator